MLMQLIFFCDLLYICIQFTQIMKCLWNIHNKTGGKLCNMEYYEILQVEVVSITSQVAALGERGWGVIVEPLYITVRPASQQSSTST